MAQTSWFREISSVIKRYRRARGDNGSLRTVTPEVRAGVLTPCVYAMICDGEKQDAELLLLFATLITSPIFDGVSSDDFFQQVAEIEGRLTGAADAEKVVLAAIEPLPDPLRETAFALAMRMIYADKTLHMAEVQISEKLQGWLKIERKTAEAVRQTMSIMARASTP